MGNDERCLDAAALCNKFGHPNPIMGDGPLRRNDGRRETVKKLQGLLKALGFDLGETGPDHDGVDGVLGTKTFKAVDDFQKDGSHRDWDGRGLVEDKLVGPRTSDALNRELVGVLYDSYETDGRLTEGPRVITGSSQIMSEGGLTVEDFGEEEVKIIVKGELDLKEMDELNITVLDEAGVPQASAPFKLKGSGVNVDGTTDGEGKLSRRVRAEDDTLTLEV